MFTITHDALKQYATRGSGRAYLPIDTTIKPIKLNEDKEDLVDWGTNKVPTVTIEVPGQGTRDIALPILLQAGVQGAALIHNKDTELECLDYEYENLGKLLATKAAEAEEKGEEFTFPDSITIGKRKSLGAAKQYAADKKDVYVDHKLIDSEDEFDTAFNGIETLPRVYRNKQNKTYVASVYMVEPLD